MTVLADTSVWVQHFRGEGNELGSLLEGGSILMHPAVLGELACGNLPVRRKTLAWLMLLPGATVASSSETLDLIENRKLFGRGIGWVDACLISSALLSGATLLTCDRRLREAADSAGVRVG